MMRRCVDRVLHVKALDHLHHRRCSKQHFQVVHGKKLDVDLLGPVPGGEYVLVLVDYYSCFTWPKICDMFMS